MDNCIFCKMIKNEMKAYTVYEDDDFKVVLDRFPSAKGHMLILPKKHFANVFEIDEEYQRKVMSIVKKMCLLLKEKYNIENINVLQNNGQEAGQSVFHYHIHIIPRKENDEININWKTLDLSDEEMEEELKKLKD